ncbi:ATP synthase F1 subcomplex delta subunit [Sanguibacter gelidistatuariae]|uniref:ATP synthase subunit delta n=1 Tax=Sanguibacter gelidistatuariae TaxID=1814289 RepID=A0A1G6VL61_9MICO|nr:F0F1 ATP synthase subunit delta [Sanguibacter gelidistatuariae]SDD54298.1 ATP synthase F1 subcomplex delta subunit [Sanguibacter gelidistatuariae]
MRGTSLASLHAAQDRLEPVLAAAGEQAHTIGDQLFAVVDALDASGALRRSLADPSRPAQDKADLARSLLVKAFDPRTVEIVEGLARARWSSERDLADAVDTLGITAYLASAQARGVLEAVESELFRITRELVGQREVRQALSDSSTDPARRIKLVDDILVGKADPVTIAICRRATGIPRGERFVPALVRVGGIAAARRNRIVASVTSGTELSQAQLDRLAALLESAYGSAVQIDLTVNPEVVGGLRIQIGSDVVDSTVLTRLADARRRLAG